MVNIISRKYFCEWANGTSFSSNTSDFATHLKGSVGEKLKMVTRVRAALIAVADQGNQFEIINGNILRRLTGSWIDDGFQPGQSVVFIADYTGVTTFTAASVEFGPISIVNISATELEFGSSIGTAGAKSDHALVCVDKFDSLIYNFGIVENGAPDSFLSPFTNDVQGYYYGSIDTTTPTEHTMTVTGGASASKSWYSGDATVKWISSGNTLILPSPATDFQHLYEVTQTFVITPVFLESFLAAYDNGTQPDDFIGANSLKHISFYDFRYDLTNPNNSVKITDSGQLGSVGWFNENYNGLNDIYTISNVVYTDTASATAVDALQLNKKTTVAGRLNGSGFTNTSKAGAYFHWAAPLGVYGEKQTSFQSTFLWDSVIGTMTAGTFTTTGTDRIKRFELTYVSATRIDFEIDIEFSDVEITLINPDLLAEISDNYFIGIQAGNTNATDTSNKTILQVDWNEFIVSLDVENLCRFENQRFYDHGMDDADGGHTDYKGWKQDGIVFGASIILNKALNANIKALACRLVAYNTTTSETFDIQKYQVNLADMVVVNAATDYQRLEVDTTRGFRLASADQFNQLFLFFNQPVVDEQEIELKIGVKLDWQSWVKLAEADTVFYSTTLDSKGMGKDASRYAMTNGYEVRMIIDADVVQDSVIATRYSNMSPYLDIYGWGLEDNDPEEWALLIETFDIDDNDLGGAILRNADTKMVCTWTPQSGSTTGFSNQWAIHRIETVDATGYNDIDELSSFITGRTGNRLKPLAGETFLKITDSGTTIVTECLIDYTKLQGLDFELSARLGRNITYARYNIARDCKLYSEGTYLMFNCPDTGIAVSNSMRLATLNAEGMIESEEAIAMSASYTYQNLKLEVAYNIVNNGRYNFYAVCFTGTATEVHEFVYNGSAYVQTRIYTANIGGSGPCAIRIDDQLEPNSRPYIWFGNRDAAIDGEKGFKHLYYDGAAWQTLNWKCYNSGAPANSQCAHPQDLIHDNANVYVMNYDNPPQTGQHNEGKIAVYYQSAGSVTTPADRGNFANYTFVNNIYRNINDTENQDGIGSVGDMAFGIGFERLEVDANSNPVFLVSHDASLGADGARHFSKIYANIAAPVDEDDWTIQTPMAATNTLYGAPQALRGTAGATTQSSPLQRKNNCHLLIVDANTFITGHHSAPYFVRHIINDWTGVAVNEWSIYTPADPSFDYTTGNILVE